MKKLKVLVFEYITGGGLNKVDLPESLAREGLLMLRALLDGLIRIEMIEPLIMLDSRMVGKLFLNSYDLDSTKSSSKGMGYVGSPYPNFENIHIIEPEHDCQQEFYQLMQSCDAVWPIAPESNSVLQSLCATVERSGKILLTSPASAVTITGNKWLTYRHLKEHSIATVPTQRLGDFSFTSGEWIIKPLDGVGCEDSYLVADQQDLNTLTASLNLQNYLIQPHIQGGKTSLSCLFKQGRGWLLCANRQYFNLSNQQYRLTGITVNFLSDTSKFQSLVKDVAKAMPELWGYLGIDLIESTDAVLVLEINPRLTTSYAGIHEALGINCVQAVFDLLVGDPQLQPTRNQPVTITITGQANHAD
jgi:tyramine---L-glutamate ligase